MSTKNTANSQIYINIPREGSVISPLNIYHDSNFEVVQAATNNRYADGNDIRLNNLGPIASFSSYKLTTSSGKHLEDISQGRSVSLRYKLITGAKQTIDLFIRIDRNRNRRQRELSNNKTQKGNFHLRIMHWNIFGFAEHQKITYGLGYELTVTTNSDFCVLNNDNATNFGETKINCIELYKPHFTPSIPQQAMLTKQICLRCPQSFNVRKEVFF